MSFLDELRRRNVLRVAAAYLVAAWLIVQVAETIFPLFGFDETPARIVVIILAVGFVPALVVAWVFELTPEGLIRDTGGDAGADAAGNKRFDRIIMLTLAAAVILFGVHTFIIDPAADRAAVDAARSEGEVAALRQSFGDKSIAVLPFVNMSSDPEQEYFGDGIAEEILNLLEKVPGLLVTSRTSSFNFRNSGMSAKEIADELGVVHILEGSVRKSGNTLRITAQLIDSRVDGHLWSDKYDRELVDIFDIQDEVAARVVEELKIKLDVDMPTSTRHDPQAYALYLKARTLLQTDDPNALDEVKRLLEQALQIEPDFIDAQVATNLYYVRRLRIYRMGGPGSSWELIEEYEEKRRALLESLRQTASEHPGVVVALAHPAISRGELKDAAAMLER
ncbi:MAG: hypothetical protein R3358_13835, partial [Woeseiaceae bacterium]|nr:hypothetical protein [Woeseiaceae bacterium]